MPERKYKHEEISTVPRGYRVRTVSRGEHEIRVAYPPGPRRRGKGRVVAILHPVGENPSCPIRHVADRMVNAAPCSCGSGEPAVFGGMCARCAREKANEARKRSGEIRRARHKRAPRFRREGNPSLVDAIRHGDKVTIVDRFGQQRTGRAVMRSSSGGWVLNMGGAHGTPGLADERNVVRVKKVNPGDDKKPGERPEQYHERKVREMLAKMPKPIRDAFEGAARTGNNPTRMQIFHDPAIKKFTAVIYDPKFGNLYASGHTKKQAAAALHERVREYRRSGRLPAGGGYGNPRRRNPDGELDQAAELYREFHGREPKEILEVQESELARKDYTALGFLVQLQFTTPQGNLATIDFDDADEYEPDDPDNSVVKVASSPNGRQLYLIGGDQDLTPSLADFGADPAKDFVDLGDAVFISYDASKWQTDFKPTIWEHKLGEESGVYPRGFFDKLNRRIFFAGGNYRVERPGIID